MRALNGKENRVNYSQIDSFHYSKFPMKMIIINFVNKNGKRRQMSIPNGYNIKAKELEVHLRRFYENSKNNIEIDVDYDSL